MDNKSKTWDESLNKQPNCSSYDTIDHYTKEGFQTLIESTKNSNALPSGKEWNFYQTSEKFNSLMDEQGNKVLGMINRIMHKYGTQINIKNKNLEGKNELIIDTNDSILEIVANHIDEMNGIRKVTNEPVEIQTVTAQLPINGSWNKIDKAAFSVNSPLNNEKPSSKQDMKSIHLLTAKNIMRPQKFFKDKIDNSNKYPWEPRIREKPNSIKPLALYIEDTEHGESFCHPYEIELEKFLPTEKQLKLETPKQPKAIKDTPLVEINTIELLNDLVKDLEKHEVFAIDLEHHSYRSFMGITCLMQISTCDTDYLIDTLALRDKLYILNEVFTKPSIVKVFHGADLDVQWLQRDLSIYVVNMFDTHQAAKQMGYSGLSLSFLLNKFCDFMPKKQFQLADWRIRPLPDELKSYAREDTHYLIYLYQMLKQELYKKGNNNDNLLKSVINMSTEICKKRYFKPILTDESCMNFYRKCKRMFDNRQMYALKHIYNWRDAIARELDESTGYVLPNHMLLQMAEALPREMQGILACCNPIPPLVRSNLLELHQIVLRAREQPLQKAIMNEENRSRGSTQRLVKINTNNPLYCPHDLTKSNEFRDDLPTLLKGHKIQYNHIKLESSKSRISAFNCEEENPTSNKEKLQFLGPYERYKLVKPYIQAEEEKIKLKTESGARPTQEEDKIAKLHEHFITPTENEESITISTNEQIQMLQQHVNEQLKSKTVKKEIKPLVAMGGTKKRKRNSSEDDIELTPTKTSKFSDNYQTTVPNVNAPYSNHKRKYDNDRNEEQHSKVNKNESNRGRNKQRPRRFRNRKQNASENFKPFDYSSVDYKQFQGGAASVRTNNKKNPKNNFRGKGKNNKNNKAHNKSATFSRTK